MMDEKEFLTQFENLSLPESEFNHLGHLWLGWLYIRDHQLGEASDKLNTGIKKYAESLGAQMKFHLTLTTTFACAIKSRFRENQRFEDFLSENQDLVQNAMQLIYTHYSPSLLNSDEAKSYLVYPDREPFPEEYQKELGL